MSVPVPPVALGSDGCSTIHNNTLYVLSTNAFQSLPLTKGANWTELPMGISVQGAVCVQATPPDSSTPEALYVIGGTANSTQTTYQGLQRYKFADKVWETLTPSTAVTQNRLYHDAVYINSTASILVYAGTQDGTMRVSSQTFTVSTQAPYNVLSFDSSNTPSISPILLPWSNSQAIMLGGSDTNTKVMVFSPTNAWSDSGITLSQAPKNTTSVKSVIINGDDGSKSFYSFDLSVSPNQVSRTVLIDATGNAVVNSAPILTRSVLDGSDLDILPSQYTKRDNLTLAAWPAYNSSFAPTGTRSQYSIAEDTSGRVVISGGDDTDPVAIFNARDNSWVNATAFFSNAEVKAQTVSSSTVSSTSSTSAPTSSSTTFTSSSSTPTSTPVTVSAPAQSTAASSGGGLSSSSTTILAAVLSSVVGLAFILALVLLCLRWRRKKRHFLDDGHQRTMSGLHPDEKDPFEFASRGFAPTPADRFRGHRHQESQGSVSSMAILMGKVGDGQNRNALGRRNGSNGSDSSSAFNKKYKNAISKPIPQTQPIPLDVTPKGDKMGLSAPATGNQAPTARVRGSGVGQRGSTRRSSGWNRYWSGGTTMNILGFGGKRATYGSGSDRSSKSRYSDTEQPMRATQESAMVPPLNLERPQGRMSRVASGSPTIAHTSNGFPLKEGIAGRIERPHSSSSSVSSYDDDRRDAFSSGVPASVQDEPMWNPIRGNDWSTGRRAPSSVYTEDNYPTNLPRSTTLTDHSKIATQGRGAPTSRSPVPHISDMSWLNLGGSSRI